jgi:hypothetical protein
VETQYVLHILSECVCAHAASILRSMRMRHIAICGPPRSTIFFSRSHKRHDFFQKLNTIFFKFSLQGLSETLLVLPRNKGDVNKMYTGLHIMSPLLLSDFKEN